MDVMRCAAQLQSLLVAHDKAVQQLTKLESYISQLGLQSFSATTTGNHCQSVQSSLSLSTASGVKQMYKSYISRKWCQIQQVARSVMSQLQGQSEHRDDESTRESAADSASDPVVSMWSFTFCEVYRRD